MKNNKSQIKIGIILGYVNMLCGNLIPFFYTPIMLEILGQNEYGLFGLASSVSSYIGLVAFGVGGAVTRFLIKARTEEGKEAEERIFGLFNVFFGIIALLAAVIGVGIAFNVHRFYGDSLSASELETMRILILIITANTSLGLSATSYNAVVSSHERFLFIQCANIITTILLPLLNLAVLFMGYKSIGMTMVTLCLGIISRFVYFIYVRRVIDLKPRYEKLPVKIIKEILVFSFWIFIGDLINRLYQETDILIIGMIPALSTSGVAIYKIGATFNHIIFNIATTAQSMLAPKINKMVFSKVEDEVSTDFAIRVGRLQGALIFLMCTGFIAFGRPFIGWYVGSEYWEAYWVAVVMMIPSIIPLVQSVCLVMLTAKNKHRFRAIVYLAIAGINVLGTYFLVNYWGIIGASVVTGIANIIGPGFVMNWFYHKKMGLDIPRFWKNILKIMWIPALMCVGALFVGTFVDFYNKSILVLGIVVYTIVYAVLWWIFSSNREEKELVLSFVYKILPSKK